MISDWREDKVEVESGRECSPPPPAAGLHDVFADTTNSPPAPPSPHPVLPLHLPLHLHLARARHPGLASRRWRTLLAHISLFFSFRLLAHRQRFTLSTQRRRSGEFLDRYRNPFFLIFFLKELRYQLNTSKSKKKENVCEYLLLKCYSWCSISPPY